MPVVVVQQNLEKYRQRVMLLHHLY